MFAGMRIKSNK
jgi:hypothetical protein